MTSHAMLTAKAFYHSPLGWLKITGHEHGLTTVAFVDAPEAATNTSLPTVEEGIIQLDEYFQGRRQQFSVSLAPEGTPFQHQVWHAVQKISFGHTTTYQAIATAIGMPAASRAVGQANMRNPLAILIPCHRVIGKQGRLTGYAGGIWRKEWLLQHEFARLL